jgi:hypothetical protein
MHSDEGGAVEQLRKVQAFAEEQETVPIAVQSFPADEKLLDLVAH